MAGSGNMSSDLQDLLDRHLAAGTIPGAVALLARPGAEPELVAVGNLRADAIVRIQSMTKPVTAVAALRLVAAGELGLDDPVERWLPELAERQVLTSPSAELTDTVAADRPITLRHLLTNTSGYGMILQPGPLQTAMAANGTEAGPEPPSLDADAWLARLAELPLVVQPGAGWRYHHSFAILGILISRLTGRSADDHLREALFGPLGMADTGYWVPTGRLDRLPAAYRREEGGGLVETEPAGGGFYAGPPPYDISHAELVSTAGDYHRFLQLLTTEEFRELRTDQVPARAKTPESFFPGFWDGMGWGYGVAVQTAGPHPGRYGWSGGQGTDFFADPDGTIAILLTQVELDGRTGALLGDFQHVAG